MTWNIFHKGRDIGGYPNVDTKNTLIKYLDSYLCKDIIEHIICPYIVENCTACLNTICTSNKCSAPRLEDLNIHKYVIPAGSTTFKRSITSIESHLDIVNRLTQISFRFKNNSGIVIPVLEKCKIGVIKNFGWKSYISFYVNMVVNNDCKTIEYSYVCFPHSNGIYVLPIPKDGVYTYIPVPGKLTQQVQIELFFTQQSEECTLEIFADDETTEARRRSKNSLTK